MKLECRRIELGELLKRGVILEIQDGNHGEKHPKAADYVEYGVPFIMANNVKDNFVDVESANKIPDQLASSLRIGFAQQGDVLLTHKGTIGNTAIVRHTDPYLMLTPQVTYYRVKTDELDNWYLLYAFRDPLFQKRMKSWAEQSTRPYLGITAQRKLSVPYRDLPEQKRLVEILRPYDDLIENNRRRIALLERAARELYREWFVRLRFPGHEHTKIVDGVPEGWEPKTAFDVMDVMSGGTPKTEEPNYWGGEIPLFTPKDATTHMYTYETEKTLTEDGLRNCNSKLYPKNTVFITARGTVGKINLAQTAMAMNQSCYALTAKNGLGQIFCISRLLRE